MTSMRARRLKAWKSLTAHRRRCFEAEARLWDSMPPVGREFGSPDFDRLMEEDRRNGTGVFDPSLRRKTP